MSGSFDAEDKRPHSVYAIFDSEDRFLYVGCAYNVRERIGFHLELSSQSPASWVIRRRMASWEEIRFPTKAEAREMERRLIRKVMPLLNKQHNPRYRKNVRELPIVASP
jgi:excinuclease UvrABC nuclease subunit